MPRECSFPSAWELSFGGFHLGFAKFRVVVCEMSFVNFGLGALAWLDAITLGPSPGNVHFVFSSELSLVNAGNCCSRALAWDFRSGTLA